MLEVILLLTAVFIYLILVLCTSHFRRLTSAEIPVFMKTDWREGEFVFLRMIFSSVGNLISAHLGGLKVKF